MLSDSLITTISSAYSKTFMPIPSAWRVRNKGGRWGIVERVRSKGFRRGDSRESRESINYRRQTGDSRESRK